MGAWGLGTFENDEASDRVYRLEATEDLELLRIPGQSLQRHTLAASGTLFDAPPSAPRPGARDRLRD
jgi:hypothetical protein